MGKNGRDGHQWRRMETEIKNFYSKRIGGFFLKSTEPRWEVLLRRNESCWTRTNDPLIKSEVLYRLS